MIQPPIKEITLPVSLTKAKEALGTLNLHFNKYSVKSKDEFLNTYQFVMLVLLKTYVVEVSLSKVSDNETKMNITSRPSIGAIDTPTEIRKCNEIITNTLSRVSEILQGRALPKQPKTTEEIVKEINDNPLPKSKVIRNRIILLGIVVIILYFILR